MYFVSLVYVLLQLCLGKIEKNISNKHSFVSEW
jgi:hypothetical protein